MLQIIYIYRIEKEIEAYDYYVMFDTPEQYNKPSSPKQPYAIFYFILLLGNSIREDSALWQRLSAEDQISYREGRSTGFHYKGN
jgi:hypothetical protein